MSTRSDREACLEEALRVCEDLRPDPREPKASWKMSVDGWSVISFLWDDGDIVGGPLCVDAMGQQNSGRAEVRLGGAQIRCKPEHIRLTVETVIGYWHSVR